MPWSNLKSTCVLSRTANFLSRQERLFSGSGKHSLSANYTVTVRVAGYIEERQTVELLTSPSAYLQFQLKADASSKPGSSKTLVIDSNVPAAAKREFEAAEAALEIKEKQQEGIAHLEK